jgi:hypothetical protein
MRGALLSIAATLVLASSASAQTGFGSGSMDGRGSHVTPGTFAGRPPRKDMRPLRRNDMRRSRRSSLVFFDDYGDYDANRSFDPDKWNDWWHDRPDRSYPRWVWRNQNCTPDRMWWSGAGWRCTP